MMYIPTSPVSVIINLILCQIWILISWPLLPLVWNSTGWQQVLLLGISQPVSDAWGDGWPQTYILTSFQLLRKGRCSFPFLFPLPPEPILPSKEYLAVWASREELLCRDWRGKVQVNTVHSQREFEKESKMPTELIVEFSWFPCVQNLALRFLMGLLPTAFLWYIERGKKILKNTVGAKPKRLTHKDKTLAFRYWMWQTLACLLQNFRMTKST